MERFGQALFSRSVVGVGRLAKKGYIGLGDSDSVLAAERTIITSKSNRIELNKDSV